MECLAPLNVTILDVTEVYPAGYITAKRRITIKLYADPLTTRYHTLYLCVVHVGQKRPVRGTIYAVDWKRLPDVQQWTVMC